MSTLAAPGPRRLPVWRTVGACYTTVARNLGQLLRIAWLWLIVMVAVYAGVYGFDWVTAPASGEEDETVAGLLFDLLAVLVVILALVIEVLFLASIAVAWHRLVLLGERVTAPVYLRLDATVWRYALYSLFLLLLTQAAFYALLLALPLLALGLMDNYLAPTALGLVLPALVLAIALLALPRLSLVLPAVALGEAVSLRQAWDSTRSNTLRLALATGLCMLPATALLAFSWVRTVGSMWAQIKEQPPADPLSEPPAYAILDSVGYALLTIFAVTLLSLTYRFFVAPGAKSAPPPA